MNLNRSLRVSSQKNTNPRVEKLLAELSPETAWGKRQAAAKKLGYLRDPDAVPELLDALMRDDFWMVRCELIQALQMIGDVRAITILRRVQAQDSYQTVRSYAAKAIERLT
jgi:bilin biosynthesis protein